MFLVRHLSEMFFFSPYFTLFIKAFLFVGFLFEFSNDLQRALLLVQFCNTFPLLCDLLTCLYLLSLFLIDKKKKEILTE